MVNINHPSLYYVGLSQAIASFPHFHAQTEFAVACISGEFTLPDRKVRYCSYLVNSKKANPGNMLIKSNKSCG